MIRFKNILRNISYTLSSNILMLIVSVIVTLVLPKVLGVTPYSYYQLYIFYVSFVGFLHFGWCDGIYLRYGGENYGNIDKPIFRGQFYSLLFFQIVISLLFIFTLYFIPSTDYEKKIVVLFTILNITLLNLKTFFLMILQATNRMKDYSLIIILDRLVFLLLVIFLVVKKIKSVEFYIMADIFSKVLSLSIAILKNKELVKLSNVVFSLEETHDNISAGINLMFANIASVLIIGVVRYGIQYQWSVEIFGKISLALSISNMIMVFINAISLAVFPIIKKINPNKYTSIYNIIRTILIPTILFLLFLYFPMSYILHKWLPDYSESFYYMGILFPVILFEGKVSLLTNTMLKALRKEKDIFRANLLAAIVSIVATVLSVFVFENIKLSVFCIVFLLAFRSAYAELLLSKYLNIKIFKDIFIELIVSICFIFIVNEFSVVISLLAYLFVFMLYLIFKKNDLAELKQKIKLEM